MGSVFDSAKEWASDPLGYKSIDKAADAQRQGTATANDALNSAYKDQMKILDPWNQSGLRALAGMESGDFQRDFTMADFQKDPGYDFRMQEGQKALERSAAARGGLQSGGTLKALSRYGQDYASNEYQNAYTRFNADRDRRFSRLSSLAGLGYNAAGGLAGAAGAYGSSMANIYTGLGNAVAASNLAKGNLNKEITMAGINAGARAMSSGSGGVG